MSDDDTYQAMIGRDPVNEAEEVQLLVADQLARDAFADDQLAREEDDRIPWDEAPAGTRRGYLARALATAAQLRALGLLADRLETPETRRARDWDRIAGHLPGPLSGVDLNDLTGMSDTAEPLLVVCADAVLVSDKGHRYAVRGLDIRPEDGVTIRATDDGGYAAVITREGETHQHTLKREG